MFSAPRASRRLATLALLFLVLFAAARTAPAQIERDPLEGRRIVEVVFEGLRVLRSEDLLSLIQSKPDSNFDRLALRNDLKNLAQRAMRVDARQVPTDEGLRLIFILEENPVVVDIRFVGNHSISSKELEKVVRVQRGSVLSREDILQTENLVRREYRAQGYMNAAVEVSAVPVRALAEPDIIAPPVIGPEPDRVLLQIFVQEGDKIRVDDLVIEGNHYFLTARLRLEIESSGSWLFFKSHHDEDAFERDLQTIRRLYAEAGFFDVRVERGEFAYNEKKRTVTPKIVIEEGPRFRFGSFSAEGATLFTPEELTAPFRKRVGEKFDAPKYHLAMEKAVRLYTDRGYLTTTISDFFEFDREKGLVNVRLEVQEGPEIKVGRVLLERPTWLSDKPSSWFGRFYDSVAPPIKDEVVLKEVRLVPGQTYSRRDEERTEDRLYRLGVFDELRIENRATDQEDVHDAVIIPEEGVTGNLLIGAGYRESMGVYVWTAFVERNLWGNADVLRVEYMVGMKGSSFLLNHFDRHLAGSDYSLDTRLYHGRARRPGFIQEKTGASTELGVPMDQLPRVGEWFDESWRGELGVRAEYVDIDEGPYDPEADFDREYAVYAARVGVSRDRLVREKLIRRNYHTTGGHYESVGIEAGRADGTLLKFGGRLDWYRRLTERLVFATENSGALLAYDADTIGPSERLYMGGGEDLRGFDHNRAGDHDRADGEVPLGGATKLLSRNELRYPIFDVLTGVLFFDIGMIDQRAFTYDATRAGAGGGIRVNIKGVLLGIDLAQPLIYRSEDRKRFFHFYLRGERGL
jgi:outer membrane protein insertion porin family